MELEELLERFSKLEALLDEQDRIINTAFATIENLCHNLTTIIEELEVKINTLLEVHQQNG